MPTDAEVWDALVSCERSGDWRGVRACAAWLGMERDVPL